MTTVPEEAVKAAASNVDFPIRGMNGLRLALTAALPHLPQGVGVKVKPLEWGKSSIGERDKAQTVVGSYFIGDPAPGSYNVLFDNDQITALLTVCPSLEAAQAAAQADYEARILSALEPSAAQERCRDCDGYNCDDGCAYPEPSAARAAALEEAALVAEARKPLYTELQARNACAEIASSIRALSSPDHADAGKVEGDGWMPIESAPRDGTVIQAWHQVHKCPVSVLWKDGGFPYGGERLNWYERSYTTAWPERAFTHWRTLPSAPSQEVAGS